MHSIFVFKRKKQVIKALLTLKIINDMKKMLLIVAVAFAAISCGNKCCNKCCNADTTATDTVEVVEEVVVDEAAAE